MPGWRESALRRDERGATAVEYGLLVALIALSTMATMTSLGSEVFNFWTVIQEAIAEAG